MSPKPSDYQEANGRPRMRVCEVSRGFVELAECEGDLAEHTDGDIGRVVRFDLLRQRETLLGLRATLERASGEC